MIFYLISLTFILGFMKGALALGGIGENITQALIDLSIIILFLYSMLNALKKKRMIAPAFTINFFLIIVIILSFLLTDVYAAQLVLFLRKFYLYFLFFYALFNIDLSKLEIKKLKKLIFILFALQIPAALMKLSVIGIQEKIVGTVSVMDGSMATIMPLLAITYLFSQYLHQKNLKYLILIILFLGVGLMSGKKAIIFYMIVLFFYMTYIYARSKFFIPRMIFFKKLFSILLLMSIVVPMFISLHPSLNPEHKVGGSIDFNHIAKFVEDYNTKKASDLQGDGQGRFDAPVAVYDRLDNGGLLNILLGFGPGEIIRSSFTKFDDPLLEKYNIGYGGRQGWLWIAMQLGVIGVIIMALFHLVLLKKVLFIHKKTYTNKEDQVYILTAVGFIFIFLLDFFSYSRVIFTTPSVALTYFFVIFIVISRYNESQNSNIEIVNKTTSNNIV